MSDTTPQAAALLQRARELLEPEPEQLAAVRGALLRKLEAGAAPSCEEPDALGQPGLAPRGLWTLGGKLGLAAGLILLAGAGVFLLRAAPQPAEPSAVTQPSAAHEPGPTADQPAVSVTERAAPNTPQVATTEPPPAIAARPARTRSTGRAAARSAAELPRSAPHTRDTLARAVRGARGVPTAEPARRAEPTPATPAAEESARVESEQPQSVARAADEGRLPDVRDRLPVPQRDLLVREVAMVDGARAALERGDDARALQILDAHAWEFPAGALSEEQLALRARALCALGRIDEGRRAVQRLAARAPGSPHLKRSQVACGIVE